MEDCTFCPIDIRRGHLIIWLTLTSETWVEVMWAEASRAIDAFTTSFFVPEDQIETSVLFHCFFFSLSLSPSLTISFFLENLIVFSLKNVFWIKCTITQQLLYNSEWCSGQAQTAVFCYSSALSFAVVCGVKHLSRQSKLNASQHTCCVISLFICSFLIIFYWIIT